MNNSVRFPHLFSAPILSDLPDEFKVSFLDGGKMQSYAPGESVLAQGEKVTSMYLIAHGAVEITSINPEGQTVLIHLSPQGDLFGDVEALGERPAAANCVASNQCVILAYPVKAVLACMTRPIFVRNIMRVNFDRLVRDNTTKFVDQFYPVEQRLCDYLYRLSADRSEISKTQADLAGLLGCARQTLNRELGRLREKGILEMEKGRIRVFDRHALLVQATTPHAAKVS